MLVARESASVPRTAPWSRDRAGPPRCSSAGALSIHEEIGRAAVEEEGAGHLQLRRDQLVGLRDRGDPARPGARRRRRAAAQPAHRDRPSPCCWRSCRSATARRSTPTRRAAATTRLRGPTCPASSPSIVAGALLVDYIMTVAVSTSSAVEQVISAVPGLADIRVEIGAVAILLIMLGNLRGLRESGNIFAIPTYLFAGSDAADHRHRRLPDRRAGRARRRRRPRCPAQPGPAPGWSAFLLSIRAFASGSVALTGTEAIANGVPAFKPPEPRNAATTLTVDGHPARRPVHRHHLRGRLVRHRARR